MSKQADIVFLTAMPPRHAAARRALLDRLDLPYPLLASEEPKGPIVQRLHAGRALPVVFIDDIARNLQSVQEHAPSCLLINLMANAEFRALGASNRRTAFTLLATGSTLRMPFARISSDSGTRTSRSRPARRRAKSDQRLGVGNLTCKAISNAASLETR
ncbi:hypothetical protein [Ensifer canadensis]